MSLRVELLALLEHVHARAQVGELPRRAVHHRQRQPRAEDLVLDRVVVDEAQLGRPARRLRRQLAEARRRHDAGRERRRAAAPIIPLPAGSAACRIGDQLAPLQRDARARRPSTSSSRAAGRWPAPPPACPAAAAPRYDAPRLLGQGRRVGGGGHGGLGGFGGPDKVAFDSTPPPRRWDRSDRDPCRPILTRSSRLTPSHIAIAAATNTDE